MCDNSVKQKWVNNVELHIDFNIKVGIRNFIFQCTI